MITGNNTGDSFGGVSEIQSEHDGGVPKEKDDRKDLEMYYNVETEKDRRRKRIEQRQRHEQYDQVKEKRVKRPRQNKIRYDYAEYYE